jgi:hypothetical protein
MAPSSSVRGSLPEIIGNTKHLYEGDLTVYFRIIFNQAPNLQLPYHNFRHMMNVVRRSYEACVYYAGELSPREMRNLLITALFHDFDHTGTAGHDDLNIARAVSGFEKHVLAEDRAYVDDIVELIRSTEYPHAVASESLKLPMQIIRDADISQGLDTAWIQQVVFGLAVEWRMTPLEVLRMQIDFYRTLRFGSEWARQVFPQSAIEDKIVEATELLEILEK